MRTTLTLIGNRVAQGFDYADGKVDKGVRVRMGKSHVGGSPLCVDFNVLASGSIEVIRVFDMHAWAPVRQLPPDALDQVRKHCAEYAAKWAKGD